MKLEIIPYIGAGPISLGMTREEIRNVVDGEYEAFDPDEVVAEFTGQNFYYDYFAQYGLKIEYDEKNKKMMAMNIFPPSQPELFGEELLGRPFNVVRDWLRTLDQDLTMDSTGLTSMKLGIGLFVEDLDEGEDAPVDGVFIFAKGYYD